MKSLLNRNTYLNQSSELELLTAGTAENNGNIHIRHKVFSTADLWNIQRQTKYRVLRRFI